MHASVCQQSWPGKLSRKEGGQATKGAATKLDPAPGNLLSALCGRDTVELGGQAEQERRGASDQRGRNKA